MRHILSLLFFFLLSVPVSAQIDKAVEKVKERSHKIIERGNEIYERGKDYAIDKADIIIDRYGLDTIDVEGKAKMVDSLLAVRYQKKGKYDEEYLERPTQRFTVKIRSRLAGSGVKTKGTMEGNSFNSNLSSALRLTTNVGFSYRGIGLSLSANPFRWKGNKKNMELRMEGYSNKYGFDVSFQNAKTYDGEVEIGGISTNISSSLVTSKIFMANGYYAFNHRRFSFPAAFTQSYRQLRSQGSWLLGASFLAGNVKTRTDDKLANPSVRTNLCYIALGGGYAYNWVVNQHWMLHASALPTLVIGSFNNVKVDGERQKIPYSFPQFIFTERLSVVYEINESHFLNLSFIAHNTALGARQDLRMNYHKWRLTLCYGFRF
ncbi:MAG: DUF4421 domain-containing protein [Bacteroidales bacterium]|nr:DUF4421 domain-containing protein [Bacteroidales bacterium]